MQLNLASFFVAFLALAGCASASALSRRDHWGQAKVFIALQSLDVPNTLHRNLLSTNAIENSFRNTRNKLGRVTRFRVETDQATRWLAFALLEVEKGFRRISGYKALGDTHKPESILPSLTLINFEHFCIIGSGYLLLFQINQ